MALTTTVVGKTADERLVVRAIGGAGDNAILSETFAPGRAFRLLGAYVSYSGAPTQAGVTVGIDSGAGAAYDVTLNTGTANVRYSAYFPAAGIPLGETDGVLVTGPAGGSGVTSKVVVYAEYLDQ